MAEWSPIPKPQTLDELKQRAERALAEWYGVLRKAQETFAAASQMQNDLQKERSIGSHAKR